MKCMCYIFTGPRTALKDTDGQECGKIPICNVYNIQMVTSRMIAYVAVLICYICYLDYTCNIFELGTLHPQFMQEMGCE